MKKFAKLTTEWTVELSKTQFDLLIGDMVPASAAEIAEIAKGTINVSGTSPDIIKSLEQCRRFLNTQHMLREIMQAFGDENVTRDPDGPRERLRKEDTIFENPEDE